jgi:hypothetical protein
MYRLSVLFAVACGGTETTVEELSWWEDPCGRGDPVSATCPTGVATVEVGTDPTCADQGIAPGDACEAAGATCMELRPIACADDPKYTIGSAAFLTCGTEPATSSCPESRRAVKKDISYLDDHERDAVASSVLGLRLARYRYIDPAKGGGDQLGYILDDAPDAPFSAEQHVNLYAYSTAIVAAVQTQQEQIEALRAEVAALRAGRCGAPPAP